jgi:hypothetical protein
MESDLSVQLSTMRETASRGAVQIAMVKQQQVQDASIIAMLDQAVRAAPPPGQGVVVDKLA